MGKEVFLRSTQFRNDTCETEQFLKSDERESEKKEFNIES